MRKFYFYPLRLTVTKIVYLTASAKLYAGSKFSLFEFYNYRLSVNTGKIEFVTLQSVNTAQK